MKVVKIDVEKLISILLDYKEAGIPYIDIEMFEAENRIKITSIIPEKKPSPKTDEEDLTNLIA